MTTLFKKFKESVRLNGLHTHQSPEFQGFNPCYIGDFFALLSKRLKRSKTERKQNRSGKWKVKPFSLSLSQGNGGGHLFYYYSFIAKQAHPEWTLYSKGLVIAIPFGNQRAPVLPTNFCKTLGMWFLMWWWSAKNKPRPRAIRERDDSIAKWLTVYCSTISSNATGRLLYRADMLSFWISAWFIASICRKELAVYYGCIKNLL